MPWKLDYFRLLAYVYVTTFAVICFLPFWMMISGSITSEDALLRNGYRLFPSSFSFRAYELLLLGKSVATSYAVSTFITIVGTALALLVTSALAYSIANKKNRYRRIFAFYVFFTMLFNGGLVPFYILVTQWLQLTNSVWAVILPLLVNPFFVLIMMTFFRKVPEEMIESGRIDGASEMVIFFRLVLPVAKPILATIGLFYALSYWNDWFMALLFISDDSKFPLQLLLRRLASNLQAARNLAEYVPGLQVPGYQMRMALTLITIGPIILAYPLAQRYFIRGLTIGSVKG